MSLGKFLDKYLGIPILFAISLIFTQDISDRASKKILFIKLRGMGDVVLTLPSVKLVRKKYPDYELHYLTEEGTEVVKASRIVDKVISFQLSKFFSIVNELRKEKYDIVVDFEQFIRLSAILTKLTGARKRIGFDSPKQHRNRGYTNPIIFKEGHIINTFASLLKPLNISSNPKRLIHLKYSDKEKDWAKELNVDIVVHPGSGGTGIGRRWPVNRFARLIDLLTNEGYKIAITGGSSEIEICKKVFDLIKNKKNVINLAGKTNLKQLFALYDNVKLAISNDTGPMHIAAAQKCMVIGLFGPNLPKRYGPYCDNCKAIYHHVSCSPCINIQYGNVPKCKNIVEIENNIKTSLCMSKITVDEVYEKVKEVMK